MAPLSACSKEAGDGRTRDDFENHTKAIFEAMGKRFFLGLLWRFHWRVFRACIFECMFLSLVGVFVGFCGFLWVFLGFCMCIVGFVGGGVVCVCFVGFCVCV